MKKVVSLFLSLVMLLSVTAGLNFSASAAEVDASYIYEELADGTAEIVGIECYGDKSLIQAVVIPETITDGGKTYKVSAVGYGGDDIAFLNFPNLRYVIIPEGVTAVNDYAFAECENLSQVIFPSTLKTIGEGAFIFCDNLVGIEVPEGVVSIGSGAFLCDSLYTVSLPSTLKVVDESAFSADYCQYVTNLFFAGTQAQWNQINFTNDNEALTNNNSIRFNNVMCADDEHIGYCITVNNNTFTACSKCGLMGFVFPFKDLYGYESYAGYIMYTSVNNRFIAGTNPPYYTMFSPNNSITRAMLVAIIYRMAGSPYDNGNNPYKSNPFSDINTNAYYYNAACWALDEGVTNQLQFRPNNNVTREQTARMLFAYAESKNMLGSDEYKKVNLSGYPDFDQVHSWAVEPLQWANYNDMITGTQQGSINPQGATKRIHATRILYGFGVVCNIGEF